MQRTVPLRTPPKPVDTKVHFAIGGLGLNVAGQPHKIISSTWMFDRQEFCHFNREFGPFTCDAACDDDGHNSQVRNRFFCPSRTFLDSDVSGDCVWLNPPPDQAVAFIQHYLTCKTRLPASTSAILVLPKWSTACSPWKPLISGMKLVKEYPTGTLLYYGPSPDSPSARKQMGPTTWPVQVYWDASVTPPAPQPKPQHVPAALVSALHTSSPGLLVLKASVGGHAANILVDSGATQEFISSAFVARTKLPTSSRTPLRVRNANGTVSTSASECKHLHFSSGTYSGACDFTVTELGIGVDLILGKSWLTLHNPAIDWTTNTLTLGPHTLKGDLHISPPSVMSLDARRMFKLLRKGNYATAFLATLSAADSEPTLDATTSDQTPEWTAQLHALLGRYNHIFEEPTHLPDQRPRDHTIDLIPGAKPPQQRTYRMSPLELAEVERQLKEYLDKGWIRPSTSPFGAPILLVRKKDNSLRMCIDYRALNAISVKNRYPLPRIDELLDQLQGAKVFSALDLWSGYHQVRVAEEDIHKTAFRTRYGHFEFTVLPFGLTNAPATFMNIMNDTLREYLDKFVVVFLDDILIYSKTPEEHLVHLDSVLATLQKHKLHVKLKKCAFGRTSIPFLGFLVTSEGIRPDPAKIEAVKSWPPPTSVSEVRSFLGFAGFMSRFIKDYSAIAAPLTHLTRSDVPFLWTPDAQSAFQAVKLALTTAPTLVLPELGPDSEFTLFTDASITAVGAVLLQDQGKGLQPVAYSSRKLNVHEVNYPITELELLAIVDALRTYRCYLEGCKRFTVVTDHDTLKYFLTQPQLSGRKARWQEFLSPYAPCMTIEYRKGALNRADALTRMPTATSAALHASNGLDAELLSAIRHGYAADPFYSSPRAILRQKDGLYYVGKRLAIPKDTQLRAKLLFECHDAAYSGHMGQDKTTAALASQFWWPHLKRSVVKYILGCATCQRVKPSSKLTPGLLQPIPPASKPWAQISMDLITDLPTASGFDSIVVFVDTFTKMAHFVPTVKSVSARQLVDLFVTNVYRLHGLPETIISDRDPRITSEFYSSLFARLGTKLALSSACHPQSDGQTERTNRTLEQILRAYVHPLQDDWPDHLPLAEFAYNNSVQASTNVTPFVANTGIVPRTPLHAATGGAPEPESGHRLERLKDVQTLISAQLDLAQARQKSHADKSRRDLHFVVGDLVRLSTRNLRLPGQPSPKLRDRFVGPLKIAAVISPTTYSLELPASMKRVHNAFHVSRLLPWVTDDDSHHAPPVSPNPLASDEQYITGDTEYEVDCITDVTIASRGRKLTLLFTVKWSGYDESANTREPLKHVQTWMP